MHEGNPSFLPKCGWGREGYFVDPDILMATLGEIKDDISSIESEVSGIKL
jgi:hypothetical protein